MSNVKLTSAKLTMGYNERVILNALAPSAVIQPVNEELVNHCTRMSCSPTVRKVTCILVMYFITCREQITKRDLRHVTFLLCYFFQSRRSVTRDAPT